MPARLEMIEKCAAITYIVAYGVTKASKASEPTRDFLETLDNLVDQISTKYEYFGFDLLYFIYCGKRGGR